MMLLRDIIGACKHVSNNLAAKVVLKKALASALKRHQKVRTKSAQYWTVAICDNKFDNVSSEQDAVTVDHRMVTVTNIPCHYGHRLAESALAQMLGKI